MNMSIIYWYYKTSLYKEKSFDCWFYTEPEQRGNSKPIEQKLALEWVEYLNLEHPELCHFSIPITE